MVTSTSSSASLLPSLSSSLVSDAALQQQRNVGHELLRRIGQMYGATCDSTATSWSVCATLPLKAARKELLPVSIASKSRKGGGYVTFFDFHPVEVARQLTLMEFAFLRAVPLCEFKWKRWDKGLGPVRFV
jgi:hypothetical protein